MIGILVFSATSYAEQIEMASDDFLDKGVLPVLYTCDGKNVPPQLTWTKLPKETQALALVMTSTEKDKKEKVHWILHNIAPNTKNIPELMSKLPAGAQVAKNSWGNTNYQSPCPDRGTAQSYLFTLYALNKKVTLPADTTPENILTTLKANTIQTGHITAIYSRWPVALNKNG